MANRRGWDELSTAYRNRLAAGGITPAAYASGVGMQAARGHARDELLLPALQSPNTAAVVPVVVSRHADGRYKQVDMVIRRVDGSQIVIPVKGRALRRAGLAKITSTAKAAQVPILPDYVAGRAVKWLAEDDEDEDEDE